MKMHQVSVLLVLIAIVCFPLSSFAQENIATYTLKKGEAFDILLVTTKSGSKDTFKEYREKAFPVAVEMGYGFLPGWNIAETTQGNHQPSGIILGKWESIAKREQFLAEIDTHVPNFHDMRKKIWSLFDLTYYEVPKDLSFSLDKTKTVVLTAYWKKDGEASGFEDFVSKWKSTLKGSGGSLAMELTDGRSPFGYYYNPDYVAISQWDDREDFKAFLKKTKKMDTQPLRNVNEYILGK